jgi:hypothetical protein
VPPPDRVGVVVNLSAKELEQLWGDLAADEAEKAHRAVWSLVAVPEKAVPLLDGRLKPAEAPARADPKGVAKLIAELDDDDFQVRERATKELEQLGARAEKALRDELGRMPSEEVRRRAEGLLEKVQQPVLSPDRLRLVRALQVLEQLGTPPARKVLDRLAQGDAEAWLTQEARASRDRLARREP